MDDIIFFSYGWSVCVRVDDGGYSSCSERVYPFNSQDTEFVYATFTLCLASYFISEPYFFRVSESNIEGWSITVRIVDL